MEHIGEDMPPTHGGDYALGHLAGRVQAMETRLDRHEAMMTSSLADIKAKLDGVLTALATRKGTNEGVATLLRWTLQAVGAAVAIAAALAGILHLHMGAK